MSCCSSVSGTAAVLRVPLGEGGAPVHVVHGEEVQLGGHGVLAASAWGRSGGKRCVTLSTPSVSELAGVEAWHGE